MGSDVINFMIVACLFTFSIIVKQACRYKLFENVTIGELAAPA